MEQQLDNDNEQDDLSEIEKNPVKTLQNIVGDIQEKQGEILKRLKNQDKSIDGIIKKLEDSDNRILKEIRTICEEYGGKDEKSITDEEVLKPSNFDSDEKVSCQKVTNLNSGKFFVLRDVFHPVAIMKIGQEIHGVSEEYFGCEWEMSVEKKASHLAVYLYCTKPLNIGKWAIDTEFEFNLKSSRKHLMEPIAYTFNNEKGEDSIEACGLDEFMNWNEMMKDHCIDKKITVEVHVKINKMIGVYKDNLRSFDVSMVEFSDAILIVNDQKFYVSKLFLASHSTYFKTLFLTRFQESSKSEIQLTGIESEDFQNVLEVLYGYPAIDETTVEGIALVADMFDIQIVMRKCEVFLIKKSQKLMCKKLSMSARYNMDKLKKSCLSKIKTVDEIGSIIPGDPEDLDHSIMTELLQKSIYLQRQ